MANTLTLKRSSVAGKVPEASLLSLGEIAVNYADRRLYARDASGAIFHWISDTVLPASIVEPFGCVWDESGDTYQTVAMYRTTYGTAWNESTDAYTTNLY